LFLLLWWLALFAWWIVLAGTSWAMLAAGAGVALLGSLLALAIRRRGLVNLSVLKAPLAIARALLLQLAGVRHPSSAYREFFFPAEGDERSRPGRHRP
jgi:hypothetical protein